jgi:uncharacterized protein YdeI (YjbR/CyaY-like superfamily)
MAQKTNGEPTVKTFRATLERSRSALGWVIAHIPFDAAKVWGKRGQIRVKGDINGFPLRTSLFPDGKGAHFLLVNKEMQAGGKTSAGLAASFRLEPDTEERVVTMPLELERALGEVRTLRRWFDQLSPSARRDICRFVLGVKSAAARVRRADQMAERLLATMEAERELPPVLRLAFARDPGAYRGWKRMPPLRRRAHLFGIFYYRTPEGQQKRVAKLIADAYEYAKREDRRQKTEVRRNTEPASGF